MHLTFMDPCIVNILLYKSQQGAHVTEKINSITCASCWDLYSTTFMHFCHYLIQSVCFNIFGHHQKLPNIGPDFSTYHVHLDVTKHEFNTHGFVHRRLLSRNTNKMQLCNRIYYSKVFLKAQHVSSGTLLIVRSSELYLQSLV
jgi:hypothetical protein